MQQQDARQTAVTQLESAGPIVLFDGVCNLCNGAVRFVIARDPAGRVRFASLQSEVARRLLQEHAGAPAVHEGEVPPGDLIEVATGPSWLAVPGPPEAGDTMLLLENGQLYARSTAALRLAGHMRGPWPVLKALLVVPERLRDAVYGLVSRRRYRWFGRTHDCRLPSPAEAARFLN